MKVIAIVISFACFSLGALEAEEPSPSPTPIFRHSALRPGPLRRSNYIERRRESEARTGAAQAKAQAQANRRSANAAQAQVKEASRTRAQAQRQVAAEARNEARNATPRANSELMSRMGFSETEIAAQKAREEAAKPGAKESNETMSQGEPRQPQPKPATSPGAESDRPALSQTEVDGHPKGKPTSASPTPADSH